MKTLATVILIALLGFSTSLSAWDGYNYTTGSYIEVESYDHGGSGEGEVEYYEDGEYRTGYLDMYPGGSGEIYDYDTGEYHEVQMD